MVRPLAYIHIATDGCFFLRIWASESHTAGQRDGMRSKNGLRENFRAHDRSATNIHDVRPNARCSLLLLGLLQLEQRLGRRRWRSLCLFDQH